MTKKPTKLPIAASRKILAADRQRELAVKPVGAGASRPEFPTRSELYRKAGLLGGAALLAGGFATAAPGCGSAPPPSPAAPANNTAPAPVAETPPPAAAPAPAAPQPQEAPPDDESGGTGTTMALDEGKMGKQDAPPPVDPALLVNGSVDGQPLPKDAPTFKVTRGGGGIGPPEEMWDPGEVDAYLSWQMAHEGKLAIKSNVKLVYDGAEVALAGFDADKNVGYVYFDKMTANADQYPADLLKKLDAWSKSGKLAILVIDQKKNPDTATLKGKVIKFLAATKKHPPAKGPLDGATVTPQ